MWIGERRIQGLDQERKEQGIVVENLIKKGEKILRIFLKYASLSRACNMMLASIAMPYAWG